MTSPAAPTPSTSPSQPVSSAPAILCWTAIQLISLALASGDVLLWARGAAGQRDALLMGVAINLGVSSVLFPWLLRSPASAIFAILLPLPMLQLLGVLSSAARGSVVQAMALVACWMGGLWLWSMLLHTRRSHAMGVALAASYAMGVPFLMYFRAEFLSETFPKSVAALWIWASGVPASAAIAHGVAWMRRATSYPHLSHDQRT